MIVAHYFGKLGWRFLIDATQTGQVTTSQHTEDKFRQISFNSSTFTSLLMVSRQHLGLILAQDMSVKIPKWLDGFSWQTLRRQTHLSLYKRSSKLAESSINILLFCSLRVKCTHIGRIYAQFESPLFSRPTKQPANRWMAENFSMPANKLRQVAATISSSGVKLWASFGKESSRIAVSVGADDGPVIAAGAINHLSCLLLDCHLPFPFHIKVIIIPLVVVGSCS